MERPVVKLIGQNGNIFFIVGKCNRALKQAGQAKDAKELSEKVFASSSYDEALQICMQYVEVE